MPDTAQAQRPGPTPVGQASVTPNTTAPSSGGFFSKLNDHFQGHGMMYLIGIGAATIVVLWLFAKRSQSAAAAAQQGSVIDPTTGQPYPTTSNTTPDQMWGSQLDADYQQMISSMNTQTGLLQQILSGQTPTPTPTLTPTPTPSGWTNPLLPFGALPSNYKWQFGQDMWVNGTEYETGPGSAGVLWGVPLINGKNLSLADWNKVAVGAGKKQWIYGPKSLYK